MSRPHRENSKCGSSGGYLLGMLNGQRRTQCGWRGVSKREHGRDEGKEKHTAGPTGPDEVFGLHSEGEGSPWKA